MPRERTPKKWKSHLSSWGLTNYIRNTYGQSGLACYFLQQSKKNYFKFLLIDRVFGNKPHQIWASDNWPVSFNHGLKHVHHTTIILRISQFYIATMGLNFGTLNHISPRAKYLDKCIDYPSISRQSRGGFENRKMKHSEELFTLARVRERIGKWEHWLAMKSPTYMILG